jgi:hypothetical protein
MTYVYADGLSLQVVEGPLEVEIRLAMLLGWTNLYIMGESLIGTPPAGAPQCRGQAIVPRWTRDWAACGPLLVENNVWPECSERDSGDVVMLAAVQAVIEKLAGGSK